MKYRTRKRYNREFQRGFLDHQGYQNCSHVDPLSAEERTPGELHVIEGIKSSLQRSPCGRSSIVDVEVQMITASPRKMGIEDRYIMAYTPVHNVVNE